MIGRMRQEPLWMQAWIGCIGLVNLGALVVMRRIEARVALVCSTQIVSTDFPSGEAHGLTGYVVSLPGSHATRCNPVNGGEACDDDTLE